jgi:ABC-type uncharacterized transport system ATPase subunit
MSDQPSDQSKSITEAPLVIEMRNIVKRFPGVLANDHVDFGLRRGEIHALLGENGAGKSTLMNVLAGLYRQDSGTILVNGKAVDFFTQGCHPIRHRYGPPALYARPHSNRH